MRIQESIESRRCGRGWSTGCNRQHQFAQVIGVRNGKTVKTYGYQIRARATGQVKPDRDSTRVRHSSVISNGWIATEVRETHCDLAIYSLKMRSLGQLLRMRVRDEIPLPNDTFGMDG